MQPRVKVCCIASVAEAELAIAAGASLLGLVGAMPSGPGPIPDQTIAEVCSWARPRGIETVLLSSETTADGLIAHAARCRPSVLQIVDELAARVWWVCVWRERLAACFFCLALPLQTPSSRARRASMC